MGYGYDSGFYGLRLDQGQLVGQRLSRQKKGTGPVVCTSLFSLQFCFLLSRSSFVILVEVQLIFAAKSDYSVELEHDCALRWHKQRN